MDNPFYIVSYTRLMASGNRIMVTGIRISRTSLIGMLQADSKFDYQILSAIMDVDQMIEKIGEVNKSYRGKY